ncbi:unnamed protein product [Hymenolepis diminuta]|uniref:RRM domain-containing protein n=1 Tax=Hymenolepis diminuta TaxID=6216 RepID=A0A0R3SBN8_HYMDI|nr:unnamed protein product [Hymenolepis diminuta]
MVKIFVGGLNRGSKSDDLRARFEVFGKVTECEIISTYAFVHMENESEANQAISKLHLTEFNGARISVELSHGRKRGGPLRYRDRRQDSRDRSRGPYDRDGSRKTDRPDLYPSMRDDRYNSSNSWYYDYLPHGHSQREYDSYEGRTYVSSSRHDSRMGTRGDYYYGDYYGYGYQSVPAPRDVRRGSSIDRSRYDSYGDYGPLSLLRHIMIMIVMIAGRHLRVMIILVLFVDIMKSIVMQQIMVRPRLLRTTMVTPEVDQIVHHRGMIIHMGTGDTEDATIVFEHRTNRVVCILT